MLTSSHNMQSQWHVVSILYHEMKKQLTRKVGFEGTPKLDPCWKSQPVAYKVNMEWKSELILWTTTILTRGSEFLMAWTNWSQTWSTRSTKTTSRRHPQRWIRKYLLLQADQRPKQNREDLSLLAHLQELYLFVREMDWYWTRSWIRSSLPSGKQNKHSSSTRRTTSRRRWSDRILETERWSSEQICALSTLLWRNVEEQIGRKRRQQLKISILYWPIRTRNSLPSSFSRSFRTQSWWSYTSWQCVNSGQFLQVHLSYWMCSQFTFHHKFRIDSGRTKFSRDRQTVLFTAVNPMHKNHKDPNELDLTKPRLAFYQKHGTCIKIRCTGSTYSLLNGKDWSSIKQGRTQSSYTIHSQLIVSRRRLWWNLKKLFTRRYMCHLDHHRRFPTKIIERAIWILILRAAATTSNESN